MKRFTTKRALMTYCLRTIIDQLSKVKDLASKDREFLGGLKQTNTKLSKKSVSSFTHKDDANTIESVVLCEPSFISGVRQSKSGLTLPIFKAGIGKIYKSTIHSLLVRLGRVNNNHIEIHADYVSILPKRIKHYRKVLNTVK